MPDSSQAQPIQPFIPPGMPQGLAGMLGQPDQQGQQPTPPLNQTSPIASSAAPPPAAGGAPPSAGAPSNADINSQMGMTKQDIAERLAKVRGLESQIEPIVQKKAAMEMPKTGFTPTWHHGEGGLGILKNLGQALELGLGATGPGEAIQHAYYGPGLRQYSGQQQQMAQQIAELQKQEEEARGTLSPLQALAYHQGQIGVREQANDINQQKANTMAVGIANRHMEAIKRIAQGDQKIGLEASGQALKMEIAQMENETRKEAIRAGLSENEATNEARKAVANELSQSGMVKEHPWISSLFPDWMPGIPQLGGGEKPTGAPVVQKPSSAQPPPKPGMQYARDPQGVLHQSKAGTPLPKGWKPDKGPK